MRRLLLGLAALAGSSAIVAAQQPPAPSIRGVVRDFGDTPIPDVEVVLVGTQLSVTTNTRGEFRIDGLAPRNYFLLVRRPGYSPSRVQVPVGGTEATEVEIYLKQVPYMLEPLVVQGTRRGLYGVVGDTAYHPALGAKVEVLGGGSVGYTDSLGRFSFPNLKGGTYLVQVSLTGYLARPTFVDLPRNGSREIVVFLSRTSADYRVEPGLANALKDLGTRLAFNSRFNRMTQGELERFFGRALCDIARLRFVTRGGNPNVIVNGTHVLRNWPLCGWNADEVALVEWGVDPCTDRTGSVALTLGLVCEGVRPVNFGPAERSRRSSGSYVMIWTK